MTNDREGLEKLFESQLVDITQSGYCYDEEKLIDAILAWHEQKVREAVEKQRINWLDTGYRTRSLSEKPKNLKSLTQKGDE